MLAAVTSRIGSGCQSWSFQSENDSPDPVQGLNQGSRTVYMFCTYTAFGQRNEKTTQEIIAQRYTFQGRESSANSAAGAPMFYRFRSYSTSLGRFGRRDPAGYVAGPNLYAYPMTNPVNIYDPYGLDGWTRFFGVLKVIGGVVETAGGIVLGTGGVVTEGGTLGVSSPVSLPAIAGGAFLTVHGADVVSSGAVELWTGNRQRTLTSQAVQAVTGSETAGELVDAAAGVAGGGASSAALARQALQRADGMVIVYRGVSEAEYINLQRTGQIMARGGPDAPATAMGQVLHSLTYGRGRVLPWPQIPYQSGYSSVTSMPGWARAFGPGTGMSAIDSLFGFGRGSRALRLGVRESDLLGSFNPLQGELLLKGGARVVLLGEASQAERASTALRLASLAGTTRMGGEGFRFAHTLSGAGGVSQEQAQLDDKGEQLFRRVYGEPAKGPCNVMYILPVTGDFRTGAPELPVPEPSRSLELAPYQMSDGTWRLRLHEKAGNPPPLPLLPQLLSRGDK